MVVSCKNQNGGGGSRSSSTSSILFQRGRISDDAIERDGGTQEKWLFSV